MRRSIGGSRGSVELGGIIGNAVFWMVLCALSYKLLANLLFPYWVLLSAKHSNPDGSRLESPLVFLEWLLYGLLMAAGGALNDLPVGMSLGALSWSCPLIILGTYLHFIVVLMIGGALRNRFRR